jgi:hypothetical protein
VRRQPERFAIEGREDALGGNVIPVAAVAGDEWTAAQIAEEEVLHVPKIALTQQRYHGGFFMLAGDIARGASADGTRFYSRLQRTTNPGRIAR